MDIILDENEWASRAIETHEMSSSVTDSLRMIARFYKDHGLKPSAIKKNLEEFIIECGYEWSSLRKMGMIDSAVKQATRRSAFKVDYIGVSETELEKINLLEGKQIKRLAFTLLCLAKYEHIKKGTDDYWVNVQDKEIMKMADIKTSLERQSSLYWTLREEGLVRFAKKVDSRGTQVLFVDGEIPVLRIKDFRNLGYQYQMYCGEPFLVCSNCGITVKADKPGVGRKQKYCKDCASKIAAQQRVDLTIKQK